MTKLLKPYFVNGKVVKGFGRGSKQLGIPTANIESYIVDNIDLENGIYFGFSQLISKPTNNNEQNCDSQLNGSENKLNGNSSANSSELLIDAIQLDQPNNIIYPMVCSLGWNPHFSNTVRSLEIHILNQFSYDFYGFTLRAAICGYIRSEQKFDSLDKLIEAIHNDINIAEQELNDQQKWSDVLNDKFFKDKSS